MSQKLINETSEKLAEAISLGADKAHLQMLLEHFAWVILKQAEEKRR